MSARLIIFLISAIVLVIIVSLSRSIYTLWQKGDIVAERETILTARQAENTSLKDTLSQVQSPEFIESQARDKLNLTKEGEVVVVLPKEIQAASETAQATLQDIPHWRQWWQLFF